MSIRSLYPLIFLSLCAACVVPRLQAQEVAIQTVRTPSQDTVAGFPKPLAVAVSPVMPVLPPMFQIESTQVKILDVVEAPPMPGLPPVTGSRKLTVHTVADPGLPDPPVPRDSPPPDSQKTQTRLSEARSKYREIRIGFLSATVYDHRRTRLTVCPSGGRDKAVTVWSNLDFNHFSGFANFEAKESDGEVRKYSLLMGIGNDSIDRRRELTVARGLVFKEPEIPKIPDGPPAFIIVSENPNAEALQIIDDLHALYRAEGDRMAQAYAARKAAHEARRTYLLANPPKPKDVTVNFWKRGATDDSAGGEGGRP